MLLEVIERAYWFRYFGLGSIAADFGRDRDRKVSNRAASGVPVARREVAGFNSELGAVVATGRGLVMGSAITGD